jgi:hypothetical protein
VGAIILTFIVLSACNGRLNTWLYPHPPASCAWERRGERQQSLLEFIMRAHVHFLLHVRGLHLCTLHVSTSLVRPFTSRETRPADGQAATLPHLPSPTPLALPHARTCAAHTHVFSHIPEHSRRDCKMAGAIAAMCVCGYNNVREGFIAHVTPCHA